MVPYMTPMMADHCLKEVDLPADDDFDIDNDTHVTKVIEAALLCKKLVTDLENMETIPGYIIYEEIQENPDKKDDLLASESQSKEKEQESATKKQSIEKELGYV